MGKTLKEMISHSHDLGKKAFSFMAGEVAIKKMNFLPVILFQALPIPVSGETIKNVQPCVEGLATDLSNLPAFKHKDIHKPAPSPT